MRTTGSVIANVQNKHSAPGICTLSGDSLLKLYRATGNEQYMELLREIAGNLPQYLSRKDRPIRGWDGHDMPEGYMSERVNMSDWEGKQNVGQVIPLWPKMRMTFVSRSEPQLSFAGAASLSLPGTLS